MDDGTQMYFLHSFGAVDVAEDEVAGKSVYGDFNFVSAVVKEAVVGVQFHPELSGPCGLHLLRNFFKFYG